MQAELTTPPCFRFAWIRERATLLVLPQTTTARVNGRDMRHVATLGVPPPRDRRDRVQTGRFVRALLARSLLICLAAWLLIALFGDLPSRWLIIGGAVLAVMAADVVWLTFRIRGDERRVAGE